MPAPSYTNAGSGNVWQTGAAVAVTITATVGNVVILQVVIDGSDTATISAVSGVANLAGTANSLTTLGTVSTASVEMDVYIGRATSTSVSASMASGGVDLYARWYEFLNVSNGSTLESVIENSTPGSTTTTNGSTAAISAPTVTVLEANRLPVCLVGVNDDNAVGNFTGESGGNWTEAVAEYASSVGTDAALQLQTASLTSNQISGGSYTMSAADAWVTLGFALKPREIPNVHHALMIV